MKHLKVLTLALVCLSFNLAAHAGTFTSSDIENLCPQDEVCELSSADSAVVALTADDIKAIDAKTSAIGEGQAVKVKTERKFKLVCKLNPRETRPGFTCKF